MLNRYYEDVNWMNVTEDSVRWLDLVNMVKSLQILLKMGRVLTRIL